MTDLMEVYRCNVCGNMVEMIHGGKGQLVCCGQPMERLDERTVDLGKEKHVPIVQVSGSKVTVRVGSVPHPMEEKHHIEWIEVIADGIVQRKFLGPGMKPEAEFCTTATQLSAREYCNIHGLWKSA
jgi:superoxide reductase